MSASSHVQVVAVEDQQDGTQGEEGLPYGDAVGGVWVSGASYPPDPYTFTALFKVREREREREVITKANICFLPPPGLVCSSFVMLCHGGVCMARATHVNNNALALVRKLHRKY